MGRHRLPDKPFHFPEPFEVKSFEMTLRIIVFDKGIHLMAAEPKDALVAEFVNSLKPFSLTDIRRCERKDCGKYFLKATKKEKRYCSNKCAWVMASRKRREANSEKKGRRDQSGKR
jgi:hypothetical protein